MMPISTKGRFATRIMVFLASHGSERPMTKYEIAAGEDLSPEYVQQIMMRLRVAGLVASHRGKSGGFSLSRDPEIISVADVLHAVEGRVTIAPCYSADHCDRSSICATRDIWTEAARLLEDLFERNTIAALARLAAEKRRNACDEESAAGVHRG